MLQVFFPEGSLEFEIRVSKDPTLDSEPSKRSRSTNFEDSRRTLLKHAAMRIETQRKHQLLLRESTKNNEEIGKEIVLELGQVAQQMEIDKVNGRKGGHLLDKLDENNACNKNCNPIFSK